MCFRMAMLFWNLKMKHYYIKSGHFQNYNYHIRISVTCKFEKSQGPFQETVQISRAPPTPVGASSVGSSQ